MSGALRRRTLCRSARDGDDCAYIDYVQWSSTGRGGRTSSSLASGLDTDLTVVTDGDADWSRVTNEYYNDGDSAKSGYITHYQGSQMETRVYGEGTLTFYWKVSSEQYYDELRFYIDGVKKDEISGDVDWQQKQYGITGSGEHSLMWEYEKDGTDSDGDDCGWVDYLQWTGDTAPSGWQKAAYIYDPSGRRIEKKLDGVTQTKYLYDGDHCIAEYNVNDTLVRKFIYGPGVDQPICMVDVEDSNAVYYYHYDALGSVVALSDSAGDTVQLYEYTVYGQVAAEDPNHPNPFLFTGRRFDTETGLYYYRARYYNPYIGCFLQTDPIGYDDGMNMYGYCGNNAIVHTDPWGLKINDTVAYAYNAHPGRFYRLWVLPGQAWNLLGVAYSFSPHPYQIAVSNGPEGLPLYSFDTTHVPCYDGAILTGYQYSEYDELTAEQARGLGLTVPALGGGGEFGGHGFTGSWEEPDNSGPGWRQAAGVIVGGIVVGAADGPLSPVADILYWGSAVYTGVVGAKIVTDIMPARTRPGSTLRRKGTPNSTAVETRPDGTTIRHYGPDGEATHDVDYGHDYHRKGDPHKHPWINGRRGPADYL